MKLFIEKPNNKTYKVLRRLRAKLTKLNKQKPKVKVSKVPIKKKASKLNKAVKSIINNTALNYRLFELKQYSFNWSIGKKVRYILFLNSKGLTYEAIENKILSIEPNIKGDNLTNKILIEINSDAYNCIVNNDGQNQYVLKTKHRFKLSHELG